MKLFDIVDKKRWKKMQDGFSKTLRIHIQTVDLEGIPFPGVNSPNPFCLDIMNRLASEVREEHEKCISRLIRKVKKDKRDNSCVCQLGGHIYAIPIEIQEGEALAYTILGPVLLQKAKDPSEYRKLAKKTRLPLKYLTNKVLTLKKFSFSTIESTLELFHEVAHYIVQLNYDTKKLRERFDVPEALDDLISDLYSSAYFEQLMNALLSTSLNTTKGSTGSIMLLDHDKDELSVKFSRGLKDDLAKNARIKVGSSLSGLVAKNRKPLLLDGNIKDKNIKSRLKRPDIKSSIVYPLEVKNRLIGVLNLNNLDQKKGFNKETLDLIGNLAHLTKVALDFFPKKVNLGAIENI